MTILEFFASHVPLFAGLSEDTLRPLAAAVEPRKCAVGQTLMFRGATIEGVYIVATGAVSVWVKGKSSSSAPVEAARLRTGQVFGEASILTRGTAGATVKVAEEGTSLFFIPEAAFLEVLSADPALRARIEAMTEERGRANAALASARPAPSTN